MSVDPTRMPPRYEPTLLRQLARAATAPDDVGILLLDGDESVRSTSYHQLRNRALRLAGMLITRGVRHGDRVAIVLPTSEDFLTAFFGVLAAGGVPVPLYPPVRLGRLREYHARTAAMLGACGACLVLYESRVKRLLGQALERARPELGADDVANLLAAAPPADHRELPTSLVSVQPDDLALVQFSSGSTAAPKPVALTHRQLQANVAAIVGAVLSAYPEHDGLRHAGVSWLPLYHDMGLIGCVLAALARPSPLTLIPPELFVARPAIWLRAISHHRGTVSPAPNFAFALCADRVDDSELEGVDLSSWRVALNGAEPVTPEALERFVSRFERFGLRREALTPVYGLSEAALAVTFSPLQRPFRWHRFDRRALSEGANARQTSNGQPLVSLGRPLPGFDVAVVDDGGRRLAADRLGRVMVRGPSLMRGYLGMPAETAAVLRDGWLDTGDRGFLHHGELYLYGRDKDLVIVRGRNHAPQDIEQALDGLDGVRPGCVVALSQHRDGVDGEALLLLVERSRDADPQKDEQLAGAARQRVVQRAGLHAEVVVLAPGTLPRTSSGKLRRTEARQLYLAGKLESPRRVSLLSMAGELFRSWLALLRLRRSARTSRSNGRFRAHAS